MGAEESREGTPPPLAPPARPGGTPPPPAAGVPKHHPRGGSDDRFDDRPLPPPPVRVAHSAAAPGTGAEVATTICGNSATVSFALGLVVQSVHVATAAGGRQHVVRTRLPPSLIGTPEKERLDWLAKHGVDVSRELALPPTYQRGGATLRVVFNSQTAAERFEAAVAADPAAQVLTSPATVVVSGDGAYDSLMAGLQAISASGVRAVKVKEGDGASGPLLRYVTCSDSSVATGWDVAGKVKAAVAATGVKLADWPPKGDRKRAAAFCVADGATCDALHTFDSTLKFVVARKFGAGAGNTGDSAAGNVLTGHINPTHQSIWDERAVSRTFPPNTKIVYEGTVDAGRAAKRFVGANGTVPSWVDTVVEQQKVQLASQHVTLSTGGYGHVVKVEAPTLSLMCLVRKNLYDMLGPQRLPFPDGLGNLAGQQLRRTWVAPDTSTFVDWYTPHGDGRVCGVKVYGAPSVVAAFAKSYWDLSAELNGAVVTLTLSRRASDQIQARHSALGQLFDVLGKGDAVVYWGADGLARLCVLAGKGNRDACTTHYQGLFAAAIGDTAASPTGTSDVWRSTCLVCNENDVDALPTACGHRVCWRCMQPRVQNPKGPVSARYPACCPVRGCNAPLRPSDLGPHAKEELEQVAIRQLSNPRNGLGAVACQLCGAGLIPQPLHGSPQRGGYVATCSGCGEDSCFLCGVEATWHAGDTSCKEARRSKKLGINWGGQRDTIIQGAKDFVATNWTGIDSKVNTITVNPYLWDPKCGAMSAFAAAVKRNGGTTPGMYGWHGTGSREAVVAIAKDGLDVKRRSGQVHGPGEYFGIQATTSAGYDKIGNMLLFWVINGPVTKTAGTYAYVVNNPSNEEMHCVPVLTVTFKDKPPVAFPSVPGCPPPFTP